MIEKFINQESTQSFIKKYLSININKHDKENIVLSILNLESRLINSKIENNILEFISCDEDLVFLFLKKFNKNSFIKLYTSLLDNIPLLNKENFLDLFLNIQLPKQIIIEYFQKINLNADDLKLIHSKDKIRNLRIMNFQDKLKIEKIIGTHFSLMLFEEKEKYKEKEIILNFLNERYHLFKRKQLIYIFSFNFHLYRKNINYFCYIKENYELVFEKIKHLCSKDELIEIEKNILNKKFENF